MKIIQQIPSRVPNEYASLKDYLRYYKQDNLAGTFSVFMEIFNAFDLESGNDYQLDLIGNIINRDRLYEAKIKSDPAPTPEQLREIYRKILKATIIKETAQYGSINEIYECLTEVFKATTISRLSFRVVDGQDMTVSIYLLFEPTPLDEIILKYLGVEIVPIAMGRELTAFGVLSTGSMVGRQSVGQYNTKVKPPVIKEVGFYPPQTATPERFLTHD